MLWFDVLCTVLEWDLMVNLLMFSGCLLYFLNKLKRQFLPLCQISLSYEHAFMPLNA